MTKYITCKVCGRQFPARSQWPTQCYCSHDCKRRAVVESRGNIPIHNAKRWVTA